MADDEDKESGYDESKDILIAEHKLDDSYTAQIRQYNGGEMKLYFIRVRKTKHAVRYKSIPAKLIPKLEEAFKAFRKAGAKF